MLLDRAVAVINGEVIMASDVEEQRRFAVFEPLTMPGGEFTPMEAMQQIVNRTLLLDQMDEQELVTPPTDADVDKEIAELREHIPACAGQHCETGEGWQRFLAAHGYTEAQLHERWKQRMQILDFVSARFRTGIRITKPEIENVLQRKAGAGVREAQAEAAAAGARFPIASMKCCCSSMSTCCLATICVA